MSDNSVSSVESRFHAIECNAMPLPGNLLLLLTSPDITIQSFVILFLNRKDDTMTHVQRKIFINQPSLSQNAGHLPKRNQIKTWHFLKIFIKNVTLGEAWQSPWVGYIYCHFPLPVMVHYFCLFSWRGLQGTDVMNNYYKNYTVLSSTAKFKSLPPVQYIMYLWVGVHESRWHAAFVRTEWWVWILINVYSWTQPVLKGIWVLIWEEV